MSWRAVARKDFQDAVRSRALWALSALFVLLSVLLAVAYGTVDLVGGARPSPAALVFFLAGAVGTFVSLAAIVTCYRSLAGEREIGSVKVLMSLPHTRFDAVFGKLLGRTAVLAVPVVGGLLIGVAVGSVLLGDVAPVATAGLLVVTLLFALAYVGIMVGLSATTGSTTWAATLTVGFFVVIELFWDVLVLAAVYATNGFAVPGPGDFPDWMFLLNQVPPTNSYVTSLSALLPEAAAAAGSASGAGGTDAVYATPWIGVLFLVGWTVVPLAIGYSRFAATDL